MVGIHFQDIGENRGSLGRIIFFQKEVSPSRPDPGIEIMGVFLSGLFEKVIGLAKALEMLGSNGRQALPTATMTHDSFENFGKMRAALWYLPHGFKKESQIELGFIVDRRVAFKRLFESLTRLRKFSAQPAGLSQQKGENWLLGVIA